MVEFKHDSSFISVQLHQHILTDYEDLTTS